jgi:hypothetical protein
MISSFLIKQIEVVAALLLLILGVPGSNLDQVTASPDRAFLVFLK